jgi:pantetheine-phosphate adenylyltransferase
VITAICPGSYDPVTNGHVDVISRAAGIFDRVVVGVVGSPHHKEPMFAIEERVEFLRIALGRLPNVEIDVFRELVVEFARKWDAKAIVKGLRVLSDFEWEFQMNQLNRHLAPDIETVYVMASPQVSFVSSSGVKEIAAFGGDVSGLVPDPVASRFKELFPAGRPGTPENPGEWDVTLRDGRTLHVYDDGDPDGLVVVEHHGTPGSGLTYPPDLELARERGLRVIA